MPQEDSGAGETIFFPPGDLSKLGQPGGNAPAGEDEPAAADAGQQPAATDGSQPAVERVPVAPRCRLEWPWGATTMLDERLSIGREFGLCPCAQELQPYRHLSRRHAELQACVSGIWVRDLHSHYRTFVNDEEVPPGQAYLIDSDSRIRLGPNFVILLKLEH